ncbi:hypothetical protein D3C84_972330 [compost metagenome]
MPHAFSAHVQRWQHSQNGIVTPTQFGDQAATQCTLLNLRSRYFTDLACIRAENFDTQHQPQTADLTHQGKIPLQVLEVAANLLRTLTDIPQHIIALEYFNRLGARDECQLVTAERADMAA